MQLHYGFRAFKPKLELFLKLANQGCGSFLSSWKRWGNLTVTARTEMQEKWVLLTVLLCEAGQATQAQVRAPLSCTGVQGAIPGGSEGKVLCHCVTCARKLLGTHS